MPKDKEAIVKGQEEGITIKPTPYPQGQVSMGGARGSSSLLSSHGRVIGSLEGMMLKLKLQYFGHLIQNFKSCSISFPRL